MTSESETPVYVVEWYGDHDTETSDDDHMAYVLAESCEEAISMVKSHHDENAIVQSVNKLWLLEKHA